MDGNRFGQDADVAEHTGCPALGQAIGHTFVLEERCQDTAATDAADHTARQPASNGTYKTSCHCNASYRVQLALSPEGL